MRNDILLGRLPFPSIHVVRFALGNDVANFAESMFGALWHNYLINKGTISTSFWHDKLGNPSIFNKIVVSLSKAGWITSHVIPERNWLEIELNENKLLEFVSVEELEQVRVDFKFTKYMMVNKEATADTLVKVNGKVRQTGLIREGFKHSANTEFYFDCDLMDKYREGILANMVKSMTKMREKYPEIGSDHASYDAVSELVLDSLITNEETFTRGTTFMDSRGRAISSSLGKIANPIGNKDFRALLVIPENYRVEATQSGIDAILLFIGELLGYKNGISKEDKIQYGTHCWLASKFHNIDLNSEDDRKDLFENIWLERLYQELDGAYGVDEITKQLALMNGTFQGEIQYWFWSTPIELDASALY